MVTAVVEQRRFFRGAEQPARQRARLDPPALVELAKMRDRLLDHPPPNPNAAHQGPIAMNLPVLLANRMTQVHASSEPTKGRQKSPKVVTTRSKPPRGPSNYLIRLASTCAKSRNPPPNCASWVKALLVGGVLALALPVATGLASCGRRCWK